MPVARWEQSGAGHFMPVGVVSRPSAVLRALFSERISTRGIWVWFFLIIAALFLVFEIIALVVGISLTRTITGAVRKADMQKFMVPHHRWELGDHDGSDHPNPSRIASGKRQIFSTPRSCLSRST